MKKEVYPTAFFSPQSWKEIKTPEELIARIKEGIPTDQADINDTADAVGRMTTDQLIQAHKINADQLLFLLSRIWNINDFLAFYRRNLDTERKILIEEHREATEKAENLKEHSKTIESRIEKLSENKNFLESENQKQKQEIAQLAQQDAEKAAKIVQLEKDFKILENLKNDYIHTTERQQRRIDSQEAQIELLKEMLQQQIEKGRITD
jgi:chromosome segregation ATPase